MSKWNYFSFTDAFCSELAFQEPIWSTDGVTEKFTISLNHVHGSFSDFFTDQTENWVRNRVQLLLPDGRVRGGNFLLCWTGFHFGQQSYVKSLWILTRFSKTCIENIKVSHWKFINIDIKILKWINAPFSIGLTSQWPSSLLANLE